MITLGVNSVFHESAAALVADGQIIAAAEEERFNRRKHAKAADVDKADVMPEQAVRFCLDRAGIVPADLDAVAYSYSPSLRRSLFRVDAFSRRGDWGSRCGEDNFLASLDRVPLALREILDRDVPIHYLPHHLTHAASVYYTSCPDDAAVLVMDGIGEYAATVLYASEGGTLRAIEEVRYPNSIGFLWEKLSSFLGFSVYDACKVMGLAAYGDPDIHRSAFEKMVRLEGDHYLLEEDILRFRLPDMEPLESLLGPSRAPDAPIEKDHADIAATLQDVTNEISLDLVNRLYALHPVADLALAGGVALNCTTNYVLKERGPFARLHVPTAPHDAGTAIGGALLVGRSPPSSRRVRPSPYLGPEFSAAEIDSALAHVALPVERPVDLPGEVARLISRGAIVGWFQGRMEFGQGPRQPVSLGRPSASHHPGRAEPEGQASRELPPFRAKCPRRARRRVVPPWTAVVGPRLDVGRRPGPV